MRFLAVLSAVPMFAGALSAQCINTIGGVNAGLVPTYTYPASDEGRSAPIDMLFGAGGFPMAGAAGPLTHAVIGSNGEMYLTSGGAAVDPQDFGAFSLDDLRGIAGASPRIWPWSDDLEGISANYQVTYDTSVPGQFKVNWVDVEGYFSGGPQFSMTATLHDSGVIDLSYSTMPTFPFAWAGVSIGNAVGTGLETSVDLTASPNSGTLGLIFQQFAGEPEASVAGRTISLIPNGSGGYLAIVVCEPASHTEYGAGCYNIPRESFYELFPDAVAANAGLQGNAMLLTPTGSGYTANWLPGAASALYVAPTIGATSLPLSNDSYTLVTPSVAFPIPGGSAPTLCVEHNGIVDAAALPNHDFDFTLTGAEVAAAANVAFYSFTDFFDGNVTPVPSGTIKTEEVANVLYVTWDAVDHWCTPQATSPSTIQFQFDLTSGNVTMVWLVVDTNTTSFDGSWWLVGYSGAGPGVDPGSVPLATTLPIITGPDVLPLSLTASPAPVINPSTLVTYTATNVQEFAPGSGLYLSTMFLSLNPLPGGFDVFGILTGTPGCNAYIVTLDVDLGAQLTFGPTATWSLTFDNVVFAPGNVIAAQAVGLYDGSFPLANGESGGFLLSNGVRSVTQPN